MTRVAPVLHEFLGLSAKPRKTAEYEGTDCNTVTALIGGGAAFVYSVDLQKKKIG
jgi:hypothetical protein